MAERVDIKCVRGGHNMYRFHVFEFEVAPTPG